MKISSASKKVLASALSAAMVVAFAPAAAFAAQTTAPTDPVETAATVVVNFDKNGGEFVKDSSMTSLASEMAKVYTKVEGSATHYYVKLSIADGDALQVNTAAVKKLGAAPSDWFIDADNNGEYDSDKETAVNTASGWLEISDTTTEVTLKANYATASVVKDQGVPFSVSGTETFASFKVAGLEKDATYVATLADPSGVNIASSGAHVCADASSDSWSALTKTSAFDSSYKLAKGDYILSITKVGESAPALTKTYTVVELTFDAGKYGSFTSEFKNSYLIDKGGKLSADQLGSTASTSLVKDKLTTDGGYTFAGWEANGSAVSDSTEFKADTVLTATYSNPRVSAVAFTVKAFAQGKAVLNISAANLADVAGVDAEGVHYQVTVSGPNGFSKVISKTDDGKKIGSTISNLALTFGADFDNYQATTSKLEAGTYTVSIAAVADDGYLLNEAQKTEIATKSVEVAPVSYDLGAADWKNAATKASVAKTQKTLAVVGTKVSDIATALAAELTNENVKPSDELQVIDYVTYNGAKAADLKQTKVSSDGVKVAVVYKEAKATLPEVAFAASGDKYVATITPAAGTTVKANDKVIGSDGKVTLAANATLTVTVTAGSKSNAATYYGCGLATDNGSVAKGIADWATQVANATTSVSTANAPVRYGATLTTLKADAVAALQATGFVKAKAGANTAAAAWAEEIAAQKKAILEKAAGVEAANIEAAKALAKGADGKYSYVSAAEADRANAAVKAVIADFEGLTAKAAGDVKDYIATSKCNDTQLVTADSTGTQYAAAMKRAATCATVKVEASDAEAVIAVNKALKEAKTAAEAKAAVEAYNKLSDAQKQLVASADIAAAQEIVSKAALVDSQDLAAARDLNGKKVTAKAKVGKKAQGKSFAYKLAASESGATASYAKVSGSKYIKISSTGKVTFSKVKVQKKAKTYKAKVSVTYGTQTVTKTVQLVVKKK